MTDLILFAGIYKAWSNSVGFFSRYWAGTKFLRKPRAITFGTTMWKRTCNNPNLDLVYMNAYIKFGENLWICSQISRWNEITKDGRTDVWTNGMTDNINPISPFSKRGYKMYDSCTKDIWLTSLKDTKWTIIILSNCHSHNLWYNDLRWRHNSRVPSPW